MVRPFNSRTLWLIMLASLALSATRLPAQPPGKGGGGSGGGSSNSSSWRTVAVSSQRGVVTSINNSGQMAGFLENSLGLPEPYAWTIGAGDAVSTTPLDFSYVQQSATGELEWVANSGAANCVNEEGMIVGTVGERAPTGALPDLTVAVIWTSPQATAVTLPLPASTSSGVFDSSEGFAISHPPSAATFPGLRAVTVGRYLWRSNGENLVVLAAWAILDDGSVQSPITLDIGVTGQFESAPLAINRGLTVVGTLDESAMVWQLDWVEQAAETSEPAGGEEPLPPGFTLAITSRLELFPKGDFSRAAGINEAGDICGQHWRSGSEHGAFLLKRVGDTYQEQSLALLVNTNREKTRNVGARALDNSASPRVIGFVDTFTKTSYTRFNRPVLWQGSSVQDLRESNTTSGLFPTYLGTINDSGRIAGQGWNGSQHLPIVMIPN